MAAADVIDELSCSICLILYTDPVMLPCGHNFCQGCIEKVLDTQEGSGAYSCPECRQEYEERPALPRNRTLGNIAERFRPTETQLGETGIFCTYCVLSPVPAAKSCLLCEASLCDTHLRGHSQSHKHILTAPTRSFGERKCPQHDELLTYYCHGESVCVCVYCAGFGQHKGHNVEPLKEAFEKMMIQLRQVLEKLPIKREETEGQIQRLQERRREVAEKAAGETERVTALFRDIREQLEALEKRLLSDISSQKEKLSLPLTNLIRELEIKKEKLGEKMRHIEELCNMADPFSLLKKLESEGADVWENDCRDIGGKESDDGKLHDENDLHEVLIMNPIYRGLGDIVTRAKRRLGNESIIMDRNTAHKDLTISTDAKSASYSGSSVKQGYSSYPGSYINQGYYNQSQTFQVYSANQAYTVKNFQFQTQVLSTMCFHIGQHYWDVDYSKSEQLRVGVAYPSIERGGYSNIGNDNKSWELGIVQSSYNTSSFSVLHGGIETSLSFPQGRSPINQIRVYLDYEAGRLSFYELSEPIRHLHTFTATFTEPLHALFWVGKGSVTVID
ncbi:E3 ubiquitin-protein ligase TRIM39 isoform X1 [Xenopus laevis]|uniref:E3 ubiquitin-protein ligase TRIM39 isoform X1 n=2 Tax=Xenopus laevis TaxID=8355 RepID=A0A1L8HJR7_XENLA|nr:E3 ubiquitin-protein ligase TRIM39 isoform X1 [Xenopus laevis]XP_018103326.1 E3 ubiquitin-protein ligase TRIM39 isoform X1 [Xenopus laevis]XP_041438804.1 E3 ubiquitin-protein ligase TRIM39 isoform X1 [Xenopus laevis]XP_041438805.1 E3 ubiquitin-protein ligase TRIM39 isoform X1 [Xenopus laevis]OCT96343.1 hypothetical protein XELAEV_18014020mg [Xenopus laevis]